MKIFFIFVVAIAFTQFDVSQSQGGLTGAVEIVTDQNQRDQIITLLEDHISLLQPGNWQLRKANKITQQVVAGALFTIMGRFTEVSEQQDYIMTVTIHNHPWIKPPIVLAIVEKRQVGNGGTDY